MSSNAIVLSIRPQYAEKIFEGTKRVELRRIRPKQIKNGNLALIYVSSPSQSRRSDGWLRGSHAPANCGSR